MYPHTIRRPPTSVHHRHIVTTPTSTREKKKEEKVKRNASSRSFHAAMRSHVQAPCEYGGSLRFGVRLSLRKQATHSLAKTD